MHHTSHSLKNERGRKRERDREFEGFRTVMANAVESNQVHLNIFFTIKMQLYPITFSDV